ncbi:MAG: hypothetical protein JNM57_16635 [Cyclobacteriaceae bacterium]|nr:hypothetical protein [Cyclobacteriaceae bacterium]
MNKIVLASVFFLAFIASQTLIAQNRYWIATTPSNWNNTANWSAASGGAGGASIPVAGSVAIFNGVGGRNGDCILDIDPTVGGLTINGYSGTIDLSGFTLTTTGTNSLSTGSFSNTGAPATLTLNGGTSTFSGTLFNVPLTGTAARLFFNGSVFNNAINLTKTSNNTDAGTGGNVFNASVELTNTSNNPLQLGETNPDIFHNTVTLNINSNSSISLARGATGTLFNENIIINYNNTGSVIFGAAGGTSTLADTKIISIGSIGASGSGNLSLSNFTQTGSTPHSFSLTGNNTATLTFGPNTIFNGNIDAVAANLGLNTSTFNGIAQLTKTGSSTNNLRGGNVFMGTTTVTNQGGDLVFGSTPGDAGDTFNGTSTFNNVGGNRIRISEETSGTVFNGDAVFNSSAATDNNNRIQVSRLAGGETTFNGSATFVNNGNQSDIHLSYDAGTSTTFNGPVVFISNASGGGDFYVGVDGTVNFNNAIEFTSLCSDVIYLSQGSGNVTLGNGSMSIGPGGFDQGQLRYRNFTQTGSTLQALTLTGTATLYLGPSSEFNGDVTFIAPRLFLNGCTYNGTTYIEKTGAVANAGTGNNIFNGVTTLVNSGSGNLISGNTSNDVFNNDLTLTNTGTALIGMAENSAGNVFGGNVTLNSTSGGGIYFCNGGVGATATLASGKSLSIGGLGFTSGDLRLIRFTQLGPTTQNVTLSSTAGTLRLGPNSQFDGDVNFIAPQILLNGATYNGTTYIEKTGGTNNTGTGNNIFNGVTTLVNSGSAQLITANTNPDTFNNDLTLTNSGTGVIYMAHNVPGTTFNGNITVNSISGNGIYFSLNASGSSTLAAGKSISVGGLGFSSGDLRLLRFTQVGATPQSITLTNTCALRLGPLSSFGGDVNFIAPQVFLNGSTFSGTAYIEKNGAGDNTGDGGDLFNGPTTLVNSGSGSFELANTIADVFNSSLIVNNTGSNRIQIGISSAGNLFNGNVTINHSGTNTASNNLIIARNASSTATFNGTLTLNCTNTSTNSGIIIGNDGSAVINGNIFVSSTNGRGILFGSATGNATLANGFTIQDAGPGTFTTGTLTLSRFTQVGGTAQNITLSGTSNITIGPSSTFNGNVTFITPQIFLNGCTFNGVTYIEKNGATANTSTGNNIFNNVTTLVNSGAGNFISAGTSNDVFNNDLTLFNTGTALISMAQNSAGNIFGGNIVVNSPSGNGIYFGDNGGASASLASGKTISVGASGFSSGELRLKRFTQSGNTTQNLTLTGAAILRVGPATTFDGAVNFISPRITLDGGTFNNTTQIEKNGNGNDDSVGGNTFNGTTTLTTLSANRWRLANTNADTYNGNITFVRAGAGTFEVAYAQTNNFSGDINVNSTAGITFNGAGSGVTRINGSGVQSVSKTVGSASPTIPRLTLAKASGTLTLNTDVTISNTATFTSGIVNTTATNYLNVANGASVSGASDVSYVDGPVRKTGVNAFTFPVGNGGFYRPISISNPTGAAHHFTAQYFRSAQTFGGSSTWPAAFYTVSACEYWTLDRNTGASSNVSVTLSWNDAACGGAGYIANLANLRVARFNTATSLWVNEGNGGTAGSTSAGTIVSAAAVTTFSPFTLASTTAENPLPVELGKFRATDLGNTVLLNWITYSEQDNDGFTIQRSATGFDFENIGERKGAGNSVETITYSFVDDQPFPGISYYRLKQTDFGGEESYSNVISVSRKGDDLPFLVYPNPVGNERITFNQKATVSVMNSLNQFVMQAEEVQSIDASSLAAGFYIIKNQKGQVARFIKK